MCKTLYLEPGIHKGALRFLVYGSSQARESRQSPGFARCTKYTAGAGVGGREEGEPCFPDIGEWEEGLEKLYSSGDV